MGGSSPEAPTTPDVILRASDEERDEAVSELGERFAEGRLSHDTFMHRMDEALGARDRRQLDGLFTDLPRRRPGLGALSSLRAEIRERARRGREMLAAETGRCRARPGRASGRAPVPGPGPPAARPRCPSPARPPASGTRSAGTARVTC